MPLASSRYIVSGGSGALGRTVTLALLGKGARVAVPYRSAAAWEDLRRAAGDADRLFGRPADIANAASAIGFTDDAVAAFGGLDGLAAVAGGYAGGATLERSDPGEWRRMMDANLETAHALCRAALPHLLLRGGSVVTVASRLAEAGGAGAAAYAVSKAGVLALTRVLALENGPRGVRFNCVVPSIIDTQANRSAMPAADRKSWTSPESIAAVIVYLLSPDSSAVNGSALNV
ncbi:MAG TPA: SDR family oxidoreductase [Vicinamibacteria bacterium]|jgi:NAD(P)-dependent dehydrogenase (short-subunit alcohol dehydrogenase family)